MSNKIAGFTLNSSQKNLCSEFYIAQPDGVKENLGGKLFLLLQADNKKIDSIAFPAISTGAFGYPVKEATEVVFKVVKKFIPKLKHIRLIRFVLYSEDTLKIYMKELNNNFN